MSKCGWLLGLSLLLLGGCMSMDEMLDSDDPFWRGIGETRAARFAVDAQGANDLQAKLTAVGKMRDQSKLVEVYLSPAACPEVKRAARSRITEESAFALMLLCSDDPAVHSDACAQIRSDAALVATAAALFRHNRMNECAEDMLIRVKDRKLIGDYAALVAVDAFKLPSEIDGTKMYFSEYSERAKFSEECGLYVKLMRFAVASDSLRRLKALPVVQATKGQADDFMTPLTIVVDILAVDDDTKVSWLKSSRSCSSMWIGEERGDAVTIMVSLEDEYKLVDYIAELNEERDIRTALRYVRNPETRQAVAAKRLELFAEKGSFANRERNYEQGVGTAAEVAKEKESRLFKLADETSAAQLERIGAGIAQRAVNPPTLLSDWNDDAIPFTLLVKIAEKSHNPEVSKVILAYVVDCMDRVYKESNDRRRQVITGMYDGAWYSWSSVDAARSRRVMAGWEMLMSDDDIIRTGEYLAANGLGGWKFLALGRSDSTRVRLKEMVLAALRRKLSEVESQIGGRVDLMDAAMRGILLDQVLHTGVDDDDIVRLNDRFENQLILLGVTVGKVERRGGDLRAVLSWAICRPDYENGVVKIDEIMVEAGAADKKLESVIGKWHTGDEVCVFGMMRASDNRRYLAKIDIRSQLTVKEYVEVRSLAKCRDEVVSSIDEVEKTVQDF